MTDFSVLRHNMVESQLRTNEVAEPRLIDAIEQTPRELFVPERYKGVAYVDEDLEIAPGRYLMEPMVLARLLQAAALSPDDVVLDVGCGTGYGAALLGRLAGSVVAPARRGSRPHRGPEAPGLRLPDHHPAADPRPRRRRGRDLSHRNPASRRGLGRATDPADRNRREQHRARGRGATVTLRRGSRS